MGDRAVALVRMPTTDGTTYIHLYAHWDGADWAPKVLAAVQAARPRWGDSEYALRKVTTELFGAVEGETGYGIGLRAMESEHPVPVFDLENGTSFTIRQDEYDSGTPVLWDSLGAIHALPIGLEVAADA